MTPNQEILITALSQFGVKEISGSRHNQIILDYFAASGHAWVKNDETAWCSAFMNWVADKCGCEKTKSLAARSWLTVGDEVTDPEQGDVVIFWRISPDTVYGHVGIYISQSTDNVYVLGGNQSNMITISPYAKTRLLGYRRLKKIELQT